MSEAACELCGLTFPSADRLARHRLKYCQGSALHKALTSTREDTAGQLTPSLGVDEVLALHASLRELEASAQQYSVADLARKLEHEAQDKKAEQQQRELAAERAAERLARERAKAETQQQLIEAQIANQRQVELEARVQLRAAERMEAVASKQKLARQQQRELVRAQPKA